MKRLRIQRYALGRLLAASWVGALLLAWPRPAPAQEVEAGKRALAAQQYERALETWQQGLDRARAEGDAALQATYHFNLGLAWQQWGEKALQEGDEASSRTRLDAAERHYFALLEINPASGGAYNNLARLYEQTGRNESAADAYARAIALDDDRQPLFLLNYADFMRRLGRAGEAVRLYRQLLEVQPNNARIHEGLVEAYLAAPTDRSRLIAYLWDLVNGGREVRALETALDVLLNAAWAGDEARIERQKTNLLTCVAVALSKGRYAPEAFLESDGARALRTLSAQDPHVGAGARELLRLYLPEAVADASSFRWWASRDDPQEDPPPGWVWPRDAFRMLIRARAAWHRKQQQHALAEAYYLLSIRLGPSEDTDPEALLELAQMYFVDGAPERVDRLLDQYKMDLFTGKAEAYRETRLKKIYEYHRTLGVMYSFIGRWGDASNPTSAIFQLEQARRSAERYNERLQPADDPAQRIHVEPQMIDFLAQGYEQTDASRAAIQVRLDAAEAYERQGDRESSAYVLKPLETRTLPADLQVRYDKIYRDRGLERVPDNRIERIPDQQPKEEPEPAPQRPERVPDDRVLQQAPAVVYVTVAGRVTDARSGDPLPGVTVIDKEAGARVTTDRRGAFSLRARRGDVLVFSLAGYEDHTATARGETLDVSLKRMR